MSSNILSILYNEHLKPVKTQAFVLLLVFIFSIASYFAYKWYIKPTLGNLPDSDIANQNSRSSEVTIYFFSAEWCPHCKRAKPEWDKIYTKFNDKTLNSYTVKAIYVDCSEGDSPLIQEYSINGYPTVIMLKDDTRVDYDAKITYDNMNKFVTDLLQ
jgi:thiol-disulfide isomerase/thioredoxin